MNITIYGRRTNCPGTMLNGKTIHLGGAIRLAPR
jgi:hypothetical protein